MPDIFEDKTKMVPAQSEAVVTSAIDKPEECFAQVPGLCKHDNHIQHAPSPKIGQQV